MNLLNCFLKCGVTRPARCTNSLLTTPSPDLTPQPPPPPSSIDLPCITTYIDARIKSDEGCQNVVRNLASLYGSRDVDVVRLNLAELSFQDFCRPNCGQVILDAWKSCDAYNDIEPAANLLIGMCASNNGSTCYSAFMELYTLVEGVGFRCIDDLYSSSVCSSECSTRIRDGVQSYGCCANVVIDCNNQFDNQYEDDDNIENEFTELFLKCGVTRPARCTNSLLTPPSPDLTPQPPPPPSSIDLPCITTYIDARIKSDEGCQNVYSPQPSHALWL